MILSLPFCPYHFVRSPYDPDLPIVMGSKTDDSVSWGNRIKLSLMQSSVWSVSNFVIWASAYEGHWGGWSILSLDVSSVHGQRTIIVAECDSAEIWNQISAGLLVSMLECQLRCQGFKSLPGKKFGSRFLLHPCPYTTQLWFSALSVRRWDGEGWPSALIC